VHDELTVSTSTSKQLVLSKVPPAPASLTVTVPVGPEPNAFVLATFTVHALETPAGSVDGVQLTVVVAAEDVTVSCSWPLLATNAGSLTYVAVIVGVPGAGGV
jgi:hypothetical protein